MILLFGILSACADIPTELPAPFTTIGATDNPLGVRRWEIVGETGDRTIIGRDDANVRVVEAIVSHDDLDNRVHVEVLAPFPAVFDLLDTGELVGEDSSAARLLAKALYDDLAHRTVPLAVEGGYGTATSEVSIFMHADINLGWSLFGYAGFQDVSTFCSQSTRSEESRVWTWGSVAKCELDWLSPIRSDCRARIKFQMAADRYGTCHWDVMIQ